MEKQDRNKPQKEEQEISREKETPRQGAFRETHDMDNKSTVNPEEANQEQESKEDLRERN